MVSTLITAMCFEKVRKTTSNITAPFDEDENMHTRQPFLKKCVFVPLDTLWNIAIIAH